MIRPTIAVRSNTTAKALFFGALLVAGSLLSCGSDGGSAQSNGSCASVAACGGPVVGTWKISSTCVEATVDIGSVCKGITAHVVLAASGSATYNADLTYVQTGSSGGTVHYIFPVGCIGTNTCAQVQANLLSAPTATAMGFTFQSATCAGSGGGCVCDAVISAMSEDQTGTYTATNETLTTVHNGTTDANQYCVNGNTMNQMPAATAGLVGSIVLTKQ